MKKNNKKDKVIEYVSFGHEVYKNLFSGLLFKLKENEKNIKNNHVMFGKDNNNNSNEINLIEENDSAGEGENDNIHNIIISNINNKNKIKNKIDDPNNFPELETTEDGSLIFAIENFNDENILKTANALNQALNKINDEVNINTFLKIYRLFAEFRWALSCRLKSDLNSNKNVLQNIDDEIINTNKGNEFYNENKIYEQPNDIYNYHKYSYETGEEIQTKDFYTENSDTTKLEIIKTNDNDNEDNHIELIDEQQNKKIDPINEIREKIKNMETETDPELSARLNEYRWPWWQIFLWLLGIIPGLIHEIWRRYKRNDLKTRAIDKMYKKLELKRLALQINFIIERQLAFLQANEVFFKDMILQSNDPKFLKQMAGKSINTFLRENNNLVNSTENYTFHLDKQSFYNYKEKNQINDEWKKKSDELFDNQIKFLNQKQDSRRKYINIDDTTTAYKKNIPRLSGAMKNTHWIDINGKHYFTKKGNLFLDKKLDNENEEFMEHYRGNLDKENSLANKRAQLIDTASHGCIMKAFDNFLGLNVLVDTKLIVTPDGYDVFMKSSDGRNAGDTFINKFRSTERLRTFIEDMKQNGHDYKKEKENILNKLKNDPLSPELQDAIIKINFLDYLCTNRDRHSTNLFVWKNGLHGIDNEFAFFTGTNWDTEAWALCIKEDLPNLIPYATQELYKIAKSLIDDKNTDKLVDIYKIFAKTANEENLLQGAENIRTRAKELYDHFKWLKKEGRILNSVKDFNSETSIKIAKNSLILNKIKQDFLKCHEAIGTATGAGFLGWINPEIQNISGPQPKQENNLFVIREENEDQDDEYDNGDIF